MSDVRRFVAYDDDPIVHEMVVCEISGVVDCQNPEHKPEDEVRFLFGSSWLLEQIHTPGAFERAVGAMFGLMTRFEWSTVEDDAWRSEWRERARAVVAALRNEQEDR